MTNLYELFANTAARQASRPAILGPGAGERISFGELRRAIDQAGKSLRAAGVRAGDCVGLHCPSGRDYIVLNYAVWRCGGCVVPIPMELAAAEKQEILRRISLRFVVSAGASAAFFEPRGRVAQLPDQSLLLPVAGQAEQPAGFEQIESAFIRFTSGTTGDSKGVVLSHRSINDRIQAANSVLAIGPDDRVLWLLSMSYHFAASIVSYLSFGATIVLPANHLAAAVLEAARRWRATLIYASPAHYAWMASSPLAGSLPHLRLALSTTATLDRGTGDAFHARMDLPLTQVLGIIEVGLPCINLRFAADRPEAVGHVLPAYRLRMEEVGLGPRLQEVLWSGPGFLDAYYHPWQTRSEIMRGGWFRTGDIGELDADGCLFLRGRVKELINVMGMKFFPEEVESVLVSHPGVSAACVLARPDGRLGEVPYARVVPCEGPGRRLSQRDLIDYCRDRLASFKVPERIEFVKTLDRTGSGKLLRRPAAHSCESTRG